MLALILYMYGNQVLGPPVTAVIDLNVICKYQQIHPRKPRRISLTNNVINMHVMTQKFGKLKDVIKGVKYTNHCQLVLNCCEICALREKFVSI